MHGTYSCQTDRQTGRCNAQCGAWSEPHNKRMDGWKRRKHNNYVSAEYCI